MRKTSKKLYQKRGFTLVETVIALTVIAIVSMTALSLYFQSENAVQSAHEKQQAQFYASDVITCYRASDTQDEFKANVAFALGLDEREVTLDDAFELSNGYTVSISIENENAENEKMTVKIVHGEKTLAQGEFVKGGAIE